MSKNLQSMKISSLSLLLATLFIFPFTKAAGEEGVILDTDILWESPACASALVSNYQATPLLNYNDSTYFV